MLDQTGLAGHYDFTLEWSNPLVVAGADTNAPSIFTAMPEQPGLRLERRQASLEFLMIDRVQVPDEN